MEDRLDYLNEIADVIGISSKNILKKEVHIFLEDVLSKMELVSLGEVISLFGSQYDLTITKPLKNRLAHFTFRHKYCHVIFNNKIDVDNNIYLILKNNYLLSDKERDDILRKYVKSYLKNNQIDVPKRLKFFHSELIIKY